jgi:hypothetical protein
MCDGRISFPPLSGSGIRLSYIAPRGEARGHEIYTGAPQGESNRGVGGWGESELRHVKFFLRRHLLYML